MEEAFIKYRMEVNMKGGSKIVNSMVSESKLLPKELLSRKGSGRMMFLLRENIINIFIFLS